MSKQSNSLTTQIKILDEKAEIPKRAHESDTGYDLKFIGIEKIVGDVIYFKTGIAIAPPEGYYFEIVPRSSISKLPLEMANSIGVIDQHYRGEVLVPIRVTHSLMGQEQGNVTFPQGIVKIFGVRPQSMNAVAQQVVSNKPKLCQMIMRKREDSLFVSVDSLDETIRGAGGFGSTDSQNKLQTPKSMTASKRKRSLKKNSETSGE